MNAVKQIDPADELKAQKFVAEEPIVVIGSGPVGMRFVQEMLKRQPNAKIHLFGNEPFQPYNRIQLSALLAGEVDREAIDIPLPDSASYPNFSYTVAAIHCVDRKSKKVIDVNGNGYSYGTLVFATGARAHVPNVKGVEQAGVYTFRNLKDTEFLYSRVASSRHIVVVGGGLLGLEAAKGLMRFNTKVTLIQQGSHLMNRQIDQDAAALLQQKIEALGVSVITSSGVREILGTDRVTGVKIYSGETVECDTVLLCAGIKPNMELARSAKLTVGHGVVVNESLQTSDPSIFAIGECCEHEGITYGLVTPGYEQAAIAADVINQGSASYTGSLFISRLKVIGESVCSMGEVVDLPQRPFQKELIYRNKSKQIYRKVVLLKGRIIGAVSFGEWPELTRVQEAYQNQRRISLWQRLLFRYSGRLWFGKGSADVSEWPEDAIVCQCNNITKRSLDAAIAAGCANSLALQNETKAGTVCGSCKPLLGQLFGSTTPLEKEWGWPVIVMASLFAVIVAAILALKPGLEVADSVQLQGWFEGIWNDKYWKQVTGFTLLGLSVVGLFMSLRKRLKWQWMGQFGYWRLLHIVLGFLCVGLLVLHTGFHLGSNLNQLLIMNFLAIIVLGALAGAMVGLGHQFAPNTATKVKRWTTWLHLLITWPLPVLLGIHILSFYYF